jgi:hypothetical protein
MYPQEEHHQRRQTLDKKIRGEQRQERQRHHRQMRKLVPEAVTKTSE